MPLLDNMVMSPPISPNSSELQAAMKQSGKRVQKKRKSDAFLTENKVSKESGNSDEGGASNQAEVIFSPKTKK